VSIASINPGDGLIENASGARDKWDEAMQKDEDRMDEVLEMNKKTGD